MDKFIQENTGCQLVYRKIDQPNNFWVKFIQDNTAYRLVYRKIDQPNNIWTNLIEENTVYRDDDFYLSKTVKRGW